MSLLAVDIGNSRIKLGLFAAPAGATSVPSPSRTLALTDQDLDQSTALVELLKDEPADTPWWIVSVNRPATGKLKDWIGRNRPTAKVRLLGFGDLPIAVKLDHPDRVGNDRLAAAAAANRLRNPARAAIIIHVGTAIVVDLVNAAGEFSGGGDFAWHRHFRAGAASIHRSVAAKSARRIARPAAGGGHFNVGSHPQRIVLGGHRRDARVDCSVFGIAVGL